MGIVLKYGNPAVDIAAGFAVGQNRAAEKRRRETMRMVEREQTMRYDTARRMQENAWAGERQQKDIDARKAMQETEIGFRTSQSALDRTAYADRQRAALDAYSERQDDAQAFEASEYDRRRSMTLAEKEKEEAQIDAMIEAQIDSGELQLDDYGNSTRFNLNADRQAIIQGDGDYKDLSDKDREELLEKNAERRRIFLRTAPKRKMPSAQDVLDRGVARLDDGTAVWIDPKTGPKPLPASPAAEAAQAAKEQSEADFKQYRTEALKGLNEERKASESSEPITEKEVEDRMKELRTRDQNIRGRWGDGGSPATGGGNNAATNPFGRPDPGGAAAPPATGGTTPPPPATKPSGETLGQIRDSEPVGTVRVGDDGRYMIKTGTDQWSEAEDVNSRLAGTPAVPVAPAPYEDDFSANWGQPEQASMTTPPESVPADVGGRGTGRRRKRKYKPATPVPGRAALDAMESRRILDERQRRKRK